jgi:hypothetical protein
MDCGSAIGELKTFLTEAADGVPLLVANDHRNAHQVHSRLKGGYLFARGYLAGLRLTAP